MTDIEKYRKMKEQVEEFQRELSTRLLQPEVSGFDRRQFTFQLVKPLGGKEQPYLQLSEFVNPYLLRALQEASDGIERRVKELMQADLNATRVAALVDARDLGLVGNSVLQPQGAKA